MTDRVMMIVTNRSSPLNLILPTGHSYVFRPNVETPVLHRHVKDCMERGVGFVDPLDEPVQRGNIHPKAKPKTQGETLQSMGELFARMVDNPTDYRNSFTAAGRPQVKWVSQQVNADVSAEMVNDVWRTALATSGATPG